MKILIKVQLKQLSESIKNPNENKESYNQSQKKRVYKQIIRSFK